MKHIICMYDEIHADSPLDKDKTLCGEEATWYRGNGRGLAAFKPMQATITKKKITCRTCLAIIEHCRG